MRKILYCQSFLEDAAPLYPHDATRQQPLFSINSLVNTAGTDWSCCVFDRSNSLGSLFSDPYPRKVQSSTRSTSTENRSIMLNTLESDVPPLNTNRLYNEASVNNCFRTQQTQKSFR